MPWVARGLSKGILTSKYPRSKDTYGNHWHGSISVELEDLRDEQRSIVEECPTNAIKLDGRQPRVDLGKCILCGRCAQLAPKIFSFAPEFETATTDPSLLVVPALSESKDELLQARKELARRVRAFGNSASIRHVDCGSDGSEEWEISALMNPIYDVQRLGITFTASPRHADILLVTGVGSAAMTESLKETYLQMPNPKIVVAVGTDAISGGIHKTIPGPSNSGIASILPVDVYVPGSPPSPFGILYGILLAMGVALDRSGK